MIAFVVESESDITGIISFFLWSKTNWLVQDDSKIMVIYIKWSFNFINTILVIILLTEIYLIIFVEIFYMYTHKTKLRVRYAETDQMKYVYYGIYAQYF